MKLLHVHDVTQFNANVTTLASLAAVVVLPLAGYWGRLALPKQEGTTRTVTLFTFKGRVSTFGGPKDPYAGRQEVLALFETHYDVRDAGAHEYFLPSVSKTKGTMRQLDPESFYVACRWDYAKASKKELRESLVTVTNPKNGKSAKAKPVDWGPRRSTGRAVDISPGLADYLGVKVDDIVTVKFEVER